ncbi:MAG TPA: hypothetical protein VLB29_10345 [Nocardioidaceae bacterium]|nr:hypothetical protein [Nocardioidaceae bacterium]
MAPGIGLAALVLLSPGATPDPSLEPADNGCGQTAYVLRDAVQNDTFTWVLNVSSIPAYLDPGLATRAIDQATSTVARAESPCLLDQVTEAAQTVFGGTTHRHANITRDTDCFGAASSDGISVVSFGPLPENVVAVTCTYSEGGEIWQSDVLLNDKPGMFTLEPVDDCVDEFDLQSVMTHERGHSFGIGHVPETEDSADLTMSAFMDRCDLAARTLGRGDVLGLGQIY